MHFRFAIAVTALCLGYLALEWHNGRAQMADFRVYYDAANALMNGDVLYGKAFGVSSGFYKYSPFACLPFIPLALLPYEVASVVYYILLTSAIIYFSLRVSNDIAGNSKELNHTNYLPILVGVFLIDHLERELHLGNINLFLLMMLYEVYRKLIDGKEIQGGILYGLILLFKPHFLLLLPYFVWKKHLKTVLFSGATIIVGLVVPAAISGWHANTDLVAQWFKAISDHNLALQSSPNTLYGILNELFFSGKAESWLVFAVLLIVAVLIALFIMKNDKEEGMPWTKTIRFREFFLLVALVPNLVHTDTEHFMWVWPLLALAIYSTFDRTKPLRMLRISFLIIAFIPFALNSPDLVGKANSLMFDEGAIGIANMLVLFSALAIGTNASTHADQKT